MDSSTIRLPVWLFRLGVAFVVFIAVLIVLGAATYIPIVRTAARVSGLERQVDQLTAENAQVQELARALDSASVRYEQIASMLGVGRENPNARQDIAVVLPAVESRLPDARPVYERGISPPTHWPLGRHGEIGFITRGQVGAGSDDEVHFGVDVAVAVGTPVRASGGGRVVDLGMHEEYGLFVLIMHSGEYESMYGHTSRLLVQVGQEVEAGQVIALSGNTGRSTAPHLHFEVRQNGRPVDPLSMVQEVQ